MKPKDVVVNKLPFLEEESDIEPQEQEMESFFNDENDFTDPMLKARFFKNTSNNDSQKRMNSFDEEEHDDAIYEIMLTIIGENTIDPEDEDIKTKINKAFSTVIKNYKLFSDIRCQNKFGRVFLQFCECIDVDSNLVFTNLQPSYKNIIKKELIKLIGQDTYKIYEKRCVEESKKVNINNHQDVIIHKI